MNKQYPTIIRFTINGNILNYLFKSWKSAAKYSKYIERNGLIKNNKILPRRNYNLNKLNTFVFVPY